MKFLQLRQTINEAPITKEVIPNMILVLKRRGIRIFPDGRKVALYVNDKYNLVFTVPFGDVGAEASVLTGVKG
jgi:hypothetical protein